MIDPECSPHKVVQLAALDATAAVEQLYKQRETERKAALPEVIISGSVDATFNYVPAHLHYIVMELLKNSMYAVYERHKDRGKMPPVRVVIR